MFRWLFPKKLDFLQEFFRDPVSENTHQAFRWLSHEEIEYFFNYEEKHWAHNVVLDIFFKDDKPDYKEELKSLANRMEKIYVDKGLEGISYYFVNKYAIDTSNLADGLIWSKIVFHSLRHFEAICSYLDKKPIPEMLEDIYSLNKAMDKKIYEQRKEKEKILNDEKLDRDIKKEFLVNLIIEMRAGQHDRHEISEMVQQKFFKEFGMKLLGISRANEVWTIKFSPGQIVKVKPQIKMGKKSACK